MFTGIIESLGEIVKISREESNIHFDVKSKLASELKIDQSIAHDGVCLTVVALGDDWHRVTAINETLEKTNLSSWEVGTYVNIERCMPANGRYDGHIVQGHVDTVAECTDAVEDGGSWRFYFQHKKAPTHLTVQKGSVTINGVSLTVVDSSESGFSVAIIPYTFENTGFKNISKGTIVNIEFDILGKYVAKMLDRVSI